MEHTVTRVANAILLLAAGCLCLASGCTPEGEGTPSTRVAELDPQTSTASLTYFSPRGPQQFEAPVGGTVTLHWLPRTDLAPELRVEEMELEIGAATVDGLTLHGAELWLAAPLQTTLQDDGHVTFDRTETRFGLSATVEVVTVEQELACAHALQGSVEEGSGDLDWGVSAYTPGEPFAARLEIAARFPPNE